jgi:hypothetical protein
MSEQVTEWLCVYVAVCESGCACDGVVAVAGHGLWDLANLVFGALLVLGHRRPRLEAVLLCARFLYRTRTQAEWRRLRSGARTRVHTE